LISNNGKVVGTYPYKKHPINEGKNCLRGRSSYKDIQENRIIVPHQKQQNKLVESSWEDAFSLINESLKSHSQDEIGIVVSGELTNEENAIIKNFAESRGIKNIGFYSHNFPNFKGYDDLSFANYEDLKNANFLFIIGNIIVDNPLIGRRVFMAKDNGVPVFSADYSDLTTTSINSDKHFKFFSFSDFLDEFPNEIKNELNKDSIIIFNILESIDNFDKLVEIVKKSNSKILPVLPGSNSFGTMNYFLPLDKNELKELLSKIKVLITVEADILTYDDGDNINLHNFDSFIAIDTSLNGTSSIADTILPTSLWFEKSGTFTNTVGTNQSFEKVIEAPETTNSIEHIFSEL
jgi:formate dehydrogenase major subunit